MKAVNTARLNVRAAGLTKDITVDQQDFKDFTQPAEKSIIITNPPYGERISTPNLLATYKMIGERLKHAFTGNDAWILSYREECFEQIGLKPSIKIPVFNGSLECEFRRYSMFDGKFKEFRSEGGIVKTERDKAEMAQKHRFKKNREFKERITAEEENEGSDIRSFKFLSLERQKERKEDKAPRFGRRQHDSEDRGEGRRFGKGRDEKTFGKGDRKGGKDNKWGAKGDRKFGQDDRKGRKGGKKNFKDNGFDYDD